MKDIKVIRKICGIKQYEFAKMMGIEQSNYANIENGRMVPKSLDSIKDKAKGILKPLLEDVFLEKSKEYLNLITLCNRFGAIKQKALIATAYFDEHVGHFTDIQKVFKLHQEVDELMEAVNQQDDDHIIDECSDVLAIAYHIATRNGYQGTPNDLFHAAYMKMKGRIERGERDYKKHF